MLALGGYTVQEPAQHRQPEWFLLLGEWLDLGKVPTDCLQAAEKEKPRYLLDSRVSVVYLGWLRGPEPTTTGITILDSTN